MPYEDPDLGQGYEEEKQGWGFAAVFVKVCLKKEESGS
jgi:hypothetical protein